MVLALAAVPFIVTSQGFLQHEVVEAVVNRDLLGTLLHFVSICLCLVLFNHHWLFNKLNIGLRVVAPLNHQNKFSPFQLIEHSSDSRVFIDQAKVAIVLVFLVAQLALSSRVIEHSRNLNDIIQHLQSI